MANESLISVPPDVNDPVVLRRFLIRLIEQLDIVIGNRQGTNALIVSQQQLLADIADLQQQLDTAAATLRDAIDSAEELIEEAESDFESEINNLQTTVSDQGDDITALEAYTAIKGYTARIDNLLGVTKSYNHNAVANTVAGQYDITLSQATYFGDNVIDNSLMTVTNELATCYSYSFTKLAANQFRVTVVDATSTPVNIAAGDALNINLVFSKPGAGLPTP